MARQPKTNTDINGYSYYRTVITIGKNADGKPIKKQFYGSTKGEAATKKKEYLQEVEAGLNPNLAAKSISQAMYTWLWEIERYSGNKSSSFEKYEGIYRNYIKDAFLGMLTISDVKKLAIQKYYNELRNVGKSYSQIKNLHKLLNKFFGYAETEGYIITNPCKGLKISKNEEDVIDEEDKIIETFSQEELKLLINSIGNKKLKFIVMFASLTGIRQGELLALEKTDIVNNSAVKINKTLRNVKLFDNDGSYNYELKTTKPKTQTSKREVPLPEILVVELKKLEKLIAEEKLKLGTEYEDNNLLFPSESGTYIDAKNLQRSWKRALEKADIKYRKFHALRHTYATKLFENGSSILTVSRLLGHSSIKTTEIYTHVLKNIKEKEVECLNSLFI